MSEINYYPEKNTCRQYTNNSSEFRRNQLSSSARKLKRSNVAFITKNRSNKNTAERKKHVKRSKRIPYPALSSLPDT